MCRAWRGLVHCSPIIHVLIHCLVTNLLIARQRRVTIVPSSRSHAYIGLLGFCTNQAMRHSYYDRQHYALRSVRLSRFVRTSYNIDMEEEDDFPECFFAFPDF